MELTERCTNDFIEIKVDELETTLFKCDKKKIQEFIQNLIHVADRCMDYTDETYKDYVNFH